MYVASPAKNLSYQLLQNVTYITKANVVAIAIVRHFSRNCQNRVFSWPCHLSFRQRLLRVCKTHPQIILPRWREKSCLVDSMEVLSSHEVELSTELPHHHPGHAFRTSSKRIKQSVGLKQECIKPTHTRQPFTPGTNATVGSPLTSATACSFALEWHLNWWHPAEKIWSWPHTPSWQPHRTPAANHSSHLLHTRTRSNAPPMHHN